MNTDRTPLSRISSNGNASGSRAPGLNSRWLPLIIVINNALQNLPYMMRQSLAPNRASSTLSSSATKLIEKKKEYDAVAALERASALFLQRMEQLSDDCDIMAKAGEGFLNMLLNDLK